MHTISRRRLCVWGLLVLWSADPAYAQRPGKFTIGVAATSVRPLDDDLGSALGVGLTVSRVARSGWGLTGALNWFESDIEGAFAGVDETIGTLRVRPLMGGVSYTILQGSLATSFSVVGGPVFSRVRIRDAVRDRVGLASDGARKISVGIRPGVNLSYAVRPRVAITGFGGYLVNRAEFTFRTAAGEIRNPWKVHALVLSAGVAVSLF